MKQFLSKGWRCYITYFHCGEKRSLVKNVIYSLRKQVNSGEWGGAVAYWLARWTPDRAFRVRALAGVLRCVLGQDT